MSPWLRVSLYVDGTLLLFTGVVWLAVHYGIGAGTGELPHLLEAWMMRVHGLAAFAGAYILGALTAVHVPDAWRISVRHGGAVHAGRASRFARSARCWVSPVTASTTSRPRRCVRRLDGRTRSSA